MSLTISIPIPVSIPLSIPLSIPVLVRMSIPLSIPVSIRVSCIDSMRSHDVMEVIRKPEGKHLDEILTIQEVYQPKTQSLPIFKRVSSDARLVWADTLPPHCGGSISKTTPDLSITNIPQTSPTYLSYSHSFIHSLTHTLTNSLTHSHTYSLALTFTHSLTHSLTYSLTH